MALPVPLWAQNAAPTVAFFPILPYGGGENAMPAYVPVMTNHELADTHPDIKRAIIVITDRSREAGSLFKLMTVLAGPVNDATFILAPQFLIDSDMVRLGGDLPDHGPMFARWPLSGDVGGWETGGDSTPLPSGKGISSFTAMDLMLAYFSDRARFPALEQVVIAGHGAGGDFVTRYAALGQGAALLEQQHIAARFVAANPSSFLYFTASRPLGGRQGFGSVDAAQCPTFNDYPYGLDKLTPYGQRIGAAAIKLGYATRDVIYLIGDKVAANDSLPDISCAANLQGANRMQRAASYYLYLTVSYGDDVAHDQKFVVVPKAGYDPAALFGSPCGLTALFGNGACKL